MPSASSRRKVAAGAGFALAAALTAALVPAAALAKPEGYVAVEARTTQSPRPVAAIIPQERIAARIELGRIAIPAGGGLIGTAIISANDRTPETLAQNAAEKADAQMEPLTQALEGFDAAILARAATAAAIAATDWLGGGPPDLYAGMPEERVREPVDSTVSLTFATGFIGSEANDTAGAMKWQEALGVAKNAFAAAHPDAGELASVTWRYEMAPDFTHVRVTADIAMTRPGAPEDHYAQQLVSIVKLRRPTFVEEDNVAIWAANDAALARTALTLAFARAGEVIPMLLALDAAGYDAATDKNAPSVTSAGYHGPVLIRDAKGPVFYAKDGDQRFAAFVATQTIRN